MAIFKRGNTWWIDITTGQGERIRRSTETTDRKAAQEFHDKLKSELWRTSKLKEGLRYTWDDAALRWLDDRERPDNGTLVGILRWLQTHLRSRKLVDIDAALLEEIVCSKKKEGVSPATINKTLMVVRAVLRMSHALGWLESVPKIRMMKTEGKRVRFLTHQEAERLLKTLPAHKADIARFSLCTGLRMANVLGLEWSQVDVIRRVCWIHPDQAKARKAIAVPLSDEAIAVIARQIGQHEQFVFTYQGKPILRVNNRGWKRSLEKAGIKNFRWHDLRHTWASWHIQAGTPLSVLQELGGWESTEMVRRYAHLSGEHLAKYAGNVSRVTNPAQDIVHG